MPELPEVETVRQGLHDVIVGQRIEAVYQYSPKLRYPIDLPKAQLKNQTITAIHRRSKYLLFQLSQDRFLCHLGMSGRISIIDHYQQPRTRHDHVDIQLQHCCLRYHDPRRFGALMLVDDFDHHRLLVDLGPEPLSRQFNSRYLQKRLCHRKIAIKQAIMNSHLVVGVGNIYASEALFHAGIHPETPSGQIAPEQVTALVAAIKKTLRAAIKAGGTTLKDFRDINAKPGYFQQKLFVYGRLDAPCWLCGQLIQALVQNNRRSYFCPDCQP
jgi:formamidopyrimidine-DNA glycosylase